MGKIKIIVVDPGHGGDDNGASWGYAEEDDINLAVSFLLRCELEKAGYKVLMTREKDEQLTLNARVTLANTASADLFLSIHCDAFHQTTASGMSVHIYPHCSQKTHDLAFNIKRSMTKTFSDHKSRGVRFSKFYVLRHTRMPAVLVECEFLSNPETRKFLKEPENQLAIARAIAKGISHGF